MLPRRPYATTRTALAIALVSALLAGPAASGLPVTADDPVERADPLDLAFDPLDKLDEIGSHHVPVPEQVTDQTANPTCRLGVGVDGRCPDWTDRYDPPADRLDGMIAADADAGRVVVTGVTEQTTTSYDAVTIAYDAETGERLWTALWDDAQGADAGLDVVLDADGRAHVIAQADTGDDLDIVHLVYDAATGARLAEDRFDSGDAEVPHQAALGPDGQVHVVASVSDGVDADGMIVVFGDDAIRSRRLDRRPTDSLSAIDVGPDGRIAATGYTESDDDTNAWTVALGPDLQLAWEAIGDRTGTGMAVDVTAGGTFVAATVNETAYLDYVVTRYDEEGDEAWRTVHDGTGNAFDIPTDIAVDAERGTVVVTGASMAPFLVPANPALTWDGVTLGLAADDGRIRWPAAETGIEASHEIMLSLELAPEHGEVFVAGLSATGDSARMVVEGYAVATGRSVMSGRYDGPGNSFDLAMDVTVEDGHVVATGLSTGPSVCTPFDVACASDDWDAITAAFDRAAPRPDPGI